MAGESAADFFVGWVFHFSAGIAGGNLNHTFQGGEDGFRAPETAVGQGGDLGGGQGWIIFYGAVFHGRLFGVLAVGLCTSAEPGQQ